MSKKYETKEVTSKHEYLIELKCDLCGAVATKPYENWGDSWNIREVTISFEMGWHCQDGGEKRTTGFDICPDCFTEKLVPWLESQGAKPFTEKSDW